VLQCVAVCFSVLQCVAVCCSVLQCVAVCCSVLQCVAVCCSVIQTRVYVIHSRILGKWCVWSEAYICCTWLIHVCDVRHAYTVWDSFMCVFVCVCVPGADICVTARTCCSVLQCIVMCCSACLLLLPMCAWLIHVCVCVCAPLIHVYVCVCQAPTYVWHNSFELGAWLIHTWYMTHLHVYLCVCMPDANI